MNYDNNDKIDQLSEKEYQDWNESVQGTIKLINRWNNVLRSKNIKFSIIAFNNRENDLYEQNFLKTLIKESKVNNWDANEIIFPEYTKRYFFYLKENTLGHFNNQGHKYFASQINLILNQSKTFK